MEQTVALNGITNKIMLITFEILLSTSLIFKILHIIQTRLRIYPNKVIRELRLRCTRVRELNCHHHVGVEDTLVLKRHHFLRDFVSQHKNRRLFKCKFLA